MLKTSKEIKQNRQNIFDNTVTGKGGGTTALQEEIAGISREIANQHPDDTPEQHQERVSKFIKDNYGDTKFGSNEKMINKGYYNGKMIDIRKEIKSRLLVARTWENYQNRVFSWPEHVENLIILNHGVNLYIFLDELDRCQFEPLGNML